MTQKLYFTAFMATVEKIIAWGIWEHSPGSAQDWRTSSDMWRPEFDEINPYLFFQSLWLFFCHFHWTIKGCDQEKEKKDIVYWSYLSSPGEYIQNRICRLSIKPFLLSILSGNAYSSINLLQRKLTPSFYVVLNCNVCACAGEPMCVCDLQFVMVSLDRQSWIEQKRKYSFQKVKSYSI